MARFLDGSTTTILGGALAMALAMTQPATASHFSVIYSFQGSSDGGNSLSGLIADDQGNLLGTASKGGRGCHGHGCGVIFKIAPDGSESVLYAFGGGAKGEDPESTLLRGADGTLYGTTRKGGTDCNKRGCGTVYALLPHGNLKILHAFVKATDGNAPVSAPVMDAGGNLYGTTPLGGADRFGTAYKLTPDGTFNLLHTFTGGSDGGFVYPGFLLDGQGDLYGGSVGGGANGGGDIYKIAADGSFSLVYTFTGLDGFGPDAPMIQDASGNFFGTTFKGGSAAFDGTVFEIAANGTESVLYVFSGGDDGKWPDSSLAVDDAGNFYGTTLQGGRDGLGTVFKLAPDGTETVLHSFSGGSDGSYPFGGVTLVNGKLYGTTWIGGADPTKCTNLGCGTVFEVTP